MDQATPGADAIASIRFDKADFAAAGGGTRCAACSEPLVDTYFEVNGATVCPRCREALSAARSLGTGPRRFVRALGAGLVAAGLGAALYYGVRAVSGYELGLIAIVVGLMVGSAVRWGCYARGGWFYQTLAIGLTYLSIVSTYFPFVLEGLRQAAKNERRAAAASVDPAAARNGAPSPGAGTKPPTSASATASRAAAPQAKPTKGDSEAGLGTFALALVVIAGIALFAPFFAGFENFMGWIIIGIALYEAWKINRRRALDVSGPFRLANRAVEPSAPVPA